MPRYLSLSELPLNPQTGQTYPQSTKGFRRIQFTSKWPKATVGTVQFLFFSSVTVSTFANICLKPKQKGNCCSKQPLLVQYRILNMLICLKPTQKWTQNYSSKQPLLVQYSIGFRTCSLSPPELTKLVNPHSPFKMAEILYFCLFYHLSSNPIQIQILLRGPTQCCSGPNFPRTLPVTKLKFLNHFHT